MKIVTLSTKDIFGGAARVAHRLHVQFLADGVENILLVNQKRSSTKGVMVAGDFHDKKSPLMQLWYKWKAQNAIRKRRNLWQSYKNRVDAVYSDLELSWLENALEKINFDVIQMHFVADGYMNFTELQGLNKPIVWTLHDCSPFTGVCSYFETCDKFMTHCGNCPLLRSGDDRDISYKVFEQKLERYANLDFHIVCPSNWMAACAGRSRLLQKYPIHVIPNGIDTRFFFPISKLSAREALGIDVHKKTVLFGGIAILADPRKGGKFLLESLAILRKTYAAEDLQLLVLGSEDGDVDFGFKTIHFGYVQDEKLIRILYAAADLTVVPSMYENLPTTIMESMSCGRPALAFKIGGNEDMIDHKINGYLATPFDSEDLAQGFKFCLDSDKAEVLCRNARQKVLDNFRIEDIANRYVELYKSLMKR